MIPATTGFLQRNLETNLQPGVTFALRMESGRIRGAATGREALMQRVYMILNTERYQYVIYSWDFGLETMDLYGKPVSFVIPELQRRITEALLCEPRISGVDDFTFDTGPRWVHATFRVHTAYGDFLAEKGVTI